jgi:hypothetical protein
MGVPFWNKAVFRHKAHDERRLTTLFQRIENPESFALVKFRHVVLQGKCGDFHVVTSQPGDFPKEFQNVTSLGPNNVLFELLSVHVLAHKRAHIEHLVIKASGSLNTQVMHLRYDRMRVACSIALAPNDKISVKIGFVEENMRQVPPLFHPGHKIYKTDLGTLFRRPLWVSLATR